MPFGAVCVDRGRLCLYDRARVDSLVDMPRDGRQVEAGMLGLARPGKVRVQVWIVFGRRATFTLLTGRSRGYGSSRNVDRDLGADAG